MYLHLFVCLACITGYNQASKNIMDRQFKDNVIAHGPGVSTPLEATAT